MKSFALMLTFLLFLTSCQSSSGGESPLVTGTTSESGTQPNTTSTASSTPANTATNTPTHTATSTPTNTATSTPTESMRPDRTRIPDDSKMTMKRWQSNGDGQWSSTHEPARCPLMDELFEIFPIDISVLTQFARPGRTGFNETIYIAHGALRADNTKYDEINVKFPASGFSLHAVNRRVETYIQSDEEQIKLEFIHPCGILVRLDHLAQLSPKWLDIVKDVPVTSDSRLTFVEQNIHLVELGEVLSGGIGHPTNTYLDFGIYDLTRKNNVAKYISENWPNYKGSGDHGICWSSFFGEETQQILETLPAGSVNTSDYCDK